MPCDWLEFDKWNNCVYLRGQPRGLLVGRRGIVETTDETWEEMLSAFKRKRYRAGMGMLKELAEGCNARAEFVLGEVLATGEWAARRILCEPNPEEAERWNRRAAEHGWWPAQRQLIHAMLNTDNPQEHLDEIGKWIWAGAEKNKAEACLYLSILFRMGYGFVHDFSKGVDWLRKAVDQEDELSLLHLGYCYETGRGVPRNLLQAQACYGKAVALRCPDADRHLQRVQNGGAIESDNILLDGCQLAVSHLRWRDPVAWLLLYPAAKHGHAEAQFLLGQMYRGGWGVTANEALALHWYRLAALQGQDGAVAAMGSDWQATGESDTSDKELEANVDTITGTTEGSDNPPLTDTPAPSTRSTDVIALAKTYLELGDIEGARELLTQARSGQDTYEQIASEEDVQAAIREIEELEGKTVAVDPQPPPAEPGKIRRRATRAIFNDILTRDDDCYASAPRLKVIVSVQKTWDRSSWDAISMGWITRDIADVEEEGWFILIEDDWLYAHNLQYNYLTYKVRFDRNDERIAIAEVHASKLVGVVVSDEFARDKLIWLIDYFLLGDTAARSPVASGR